MRGVQNLAAAALVAAVSCCRVALADAIAPGDEYRWLLFSGVDLWRNGAFAHGGILWSPGGLGREGFTLKLLLAGGTYYYDVGGSSVKGLLRLASIMPGWRIKQDRLEIVVFAGADVQEHSLGPDDLGNRLRGIHYGVRFGGDLWLQPTDRLMAAGSFSVSSIAWQYFTRAQLGLLVPGIGWLGPEYHAIGDTSYRQQRWGIHLTGFRTFMFEWSLGAGYLTDSADRSGPYGRLGLNVRR
jgi:hypothetical protein